MQLWCWCSKVNMTYFNVLIAITGLSAIMAADGLYFCYWYAGANNRQGIGRFGVSDLPTNLCSHIVYSFLGPTKDGNIKFLVKETVTEGKSNTFEDFVSLRNTNPDLKLIVSAGGWVESSERFSPMVNNAAARENFVANVVEFLRAKGLQGFNIDWEYPAQKGGLRSDKDAFILLLRDLKYAFQQDDFELTVAVGKTQATIDKSYDVAEIAKYADYIHVMTYDFHVGGENKTGVSSPLYHQENDALDDIHNVNVSINTWLKMGVPASKLLLGIGPYGHTYTLASLNDVGTCAPAIGPGTPGSFTHEPGIWAYYEICSDQIANPIQWDITEVKGNYVYANKDTFWVGYDNIDTAYAKGRFARDLGLAGVVFWAVDLDDFSGICGAKFPIITAGIGGYYL